ncbi:MAG: hypothetical protein IJY29_05980 [Ruminococcus sp.]|nr:hypothetical protein [Ruminococcus sp.]MBQ4534804.1 hypothetical protein [Ruminococcus sp.]MBQ9079101.1 hypothetical protein [Ruminococcus sp.]MBR6622967.1 hypothetical protein [Ruminococcus sp.]
MINPASLLNLKRCFGLFRTNHPKAIQFAEAVAGKITEGSIVEINVQFPDGTKSKANIKVNSSDIELIRELRKAVGK